jgi:hypothetical protein
MNRTPSGTKAGADTVSVYIEPRPGVSKEQLQSALKAANVTAVSEVTPGILSARMPAANVRALEAVAGVEVIHQKFMR